MVTKEVPFPLVHGKSLAKACRPPLDLELPDYRLVPAHEGLAVLIPTTMFEDETPLGIRNGSVLEGGADIDKDQQLASAFLRLKDLVSHSEWTASSTPYADLDGTFAAAASDPRVCEDLEQAVRSMPSLIGAVDAFFAAIAMAASAQWWRSPLIHRGATARGWFIGRWLPTALVVDGPVVRFLRSQAFRRLGDQSLQELRAVRRFLQEKTVVSFRHALAHWSFVWETHDDGNYVVCHDRAGKVIALHQQEADAVHIVTFAIIDVFYGRCLRRFRHSLSGPPASHQDHGAPGPASA